MKKRRFILLKIDRKAAIWSMALLLTGFLGYEVVSESLTLTTYYPSPMGIYKKISTTGKTELATESGDVTLAVGTGKVGIGKSDPQKKLDVVGEGSISGKLDIGGDIVVDGIIDGKSLIKAKNMEAGNIKLGNGGACSSSADNGKVGVTDGSIRICDGNSWKSIQGVDRSHCATPIGTETERNGSTCQACETVIKVYYPGKTCGGSCGRCTIASGWVDPPGGQRTCSHSIQIPLNRCGSTRGCRVRYTCGGSGTCISNSTKVLCRSQ